MELNLLKSQTAFRTFEKEKTKTKKQRKIIASKSQSKIEKKNELNQNKYISRKVEKK